MKGVCPRPLTAACVCVWGMLIRQRDIARRAIKKKTNLFLTCIPLPAFHIIVGSYLPMLTRSYLFQRWELLICQSPSSNKCTMERAFCQFTLQYCCVTGFMFASGAVTNSL